MTLNCRGRLLDLDTPVVMGILNITPDSFFDGGAYMAPESAVTRIGKMLDEGAGIIDVGAFSSKPGSELVSVKAELERLLPVLEVALEQYPDAIFSVDTCRAEVADLVLDMGVHIINDITAGRYDPDMAHVVARENAPFIAMHMQGMPETMQEKPVYEDVVREILLFFRERIHALRDTGISDIVLDPGFGFGKTVGHNYTLLNALHVFRILDCPVLAGISRKSMICRVLGVSPGNALNGTTALHMVALQQGARILRVHDVKEAVETIRLHLEMKKHHFDHA